MTARRSTLIALLAAAAALSLAASASAAAPAWKLTSTAPTAAAPGEAFAFILHLHNGGDAATVPGPCPGAQCQTLTATLPEGLTALATSPTNPDWECSLPDAHHVTCVDAQAIPPAVGQVIPTLSISAEVGALAPPSAVASFTLSGGAAATATIHDATLIATEPTPFAIDSFDAQLSGPAGQLFTQAAGKPDAIDTQIDLTRVTDTSPQTGVKQVEPLRDVFATLPPGLIGNPSAAARCTIAALVNTKGILEMPLCPLGSQIGVTTVDANYGGGFGADYAWGPLSVFNMVPPPGVAARFGFNVGGTAVVLDAKLRSGSDYGVTIASRGIPEALQLIGTEVTIWGDPEAPSHDALRSCPGELQPYQPNSSSCTVPGATPKAFLRLPTSCAGPQESTLLADSWHHPGALGPDGLPAASDPSWKPASVISHEAPGYPNPPSEWGPPIGTTGCEAVPFTPEATVAPTTTQADSPSGLEVDLSIPQTCWGAGEAESTCQSDLKKAVVALPQGMSVNPASADGLAACSSSQIGLLGTEFPAPAPIHFTDQAPNCPDAAKIGSAEVTTPLLDHKIKAGVYLAAQGDNPFNSLLALYIAGRDPESGVVLKLAGRVEAKADGQLVTSFDNQPQLPFEALHLELFGGSRAPLRTPPTCGQFTTQATLTPWSGNEAVSKDSSFEITSGPGGSPCPTGQFNPKLSAGTVNPLAATFSPFVLKLSREDGSRELTGLSATLPPGLIGKLAGIPYCPDSVLAAIPTAEGTGAAQNASPSCPAASQVGTVTAGAGAGTNPFYVTTGRAYWAGPYKGAPLSLAIVTPALAGPFDLGNVVVRTALNVDETTTQITATSDPIPTILDGIPLDLRSLEVNMNRPNFTLNPTSCNPMAVTGVVGGTNGASANVSNRFQVGNCAALAFKPKLALKLKGGTKRNKNPALTATLTYPKGNYANIASAQVTLPHSAFLDQSHIRTVCTRVQFAAHACPAASVYGHATAWSPLLDQPLSGPVYLRSSSNKLPDLVADLNGQIEVTLAGKIDTGKGGGIRNTFTAVPDAPVSKFVLSMQGGSKGLLVNSENICKKPQHAIADFTGQNGKIYDTTPLIANSCKGGKGKKGHKGHKHKGAHK